MKRNSSLLLVTGILISSCKSSQLPDSPGLSSAGATKFETMTTPARVLAYSWTNDPSAVGGPENARRFVEKVVASAAQNRGLGGLSGDNEEGFGLYTAADPVNSKDYGRILVEVPLIAGSKLGVGIGGRSDVLPMVQAVDEIPAIIYSFGGIEFSGGGRAIVMRSTEILDLTQAKSYDCRSGDKFFAMHPPMKISQGTSPNEIVQNWCDQIQFFARVRNSKELRTQDGKTSNYAVLEALYAEIYNRGTRARQLLAEVRGGAKKDKFPLLSENMERQFGGRFGTEEYKWQIYLEGLFKKLMETLPVDPEAGREKLFGDSPALPEMIELFRYLGSLPATEKPESAAKLVEALIAHWKSTPNALERLSEAIDAVAQLKTVTTREGFNSWKVPNLER